MRRRRTMRRIVLVPLWSTHVHVLVGETMRHAVRCARRLWPAAEVPADAAEALGYTILLPADEGVLVLLPADATAGTLAHECVHAATYVLARVGVPVSTDDDEALAYTLGHLVDDVGPWVADARAALDA